MEYFVNRRKAFRGGTVDEANLTAWFKADGDVYNTGTTQATDGQTVDKWVDATGNGHDVTQATAGNRPLFQAAQQNGLPGVQFVSSDFLTKGSAVLTAAPMTVYAVAETSSIDTFQGIVTLVNNTSSVQWLSLNAEVDLAGDYATWWNRGTGGIQKAFTANSILVNTAFLAVGQEASATSRSAWLDGGVGGTNTNSATVTGINDFNMGMIRDFSPTSPLVGFIYEVRVYNVAHDTTTRNAVEAELNAKWGL